MLQTSPTHGLTNFEARERLTKYGQNKFEGELKKIVNEYIYQSFIDFLKQFINPLIQLLLICVIISAAIGEYESAASVGLAVIIVCTISYVQERRADKSLEKLNKNLPNICKVIRENRTQEMESHLLVPGDIVILSEGQRVPADLRLFEIHSLCINESNLTGETQSQVKSSDPTPRVRESIIQKEKVDIGALHHQISHSVITLQNANDEDRNIIAKNLALMGTMVETGHAKGIVICTGNETRYGEVYSMLQEIVHPKSPLQVNIDQLSIHLVMIACLVIASLAIVGIVQQRPFMEVAFYAISLAVTAIPEGLPVVVAVIMALGVMRLSKRKTIVKSLNSIETLGCIQILCADKTGTLTRNEMTLTDVVTSELHSLSSLELEELNNEECRKQMTFNNFGGKMYAIGRLMEVGTLCNNATYCTAPVLLAKVDSTSEDQSTSESGSTTGQSATGGQYTLIGQATECAILDAAMRLGFGDSRQKFERLSEQPFQSSTRRMVVYCQRTDLPGNSPMYYVKGAWEDLLDDCTHYYDCGLVKPRTNEMWLEYARICTALGSQGLRVLALATGVTMEELTFVGVVGINNAARDGIKETIEQLKDKFYVDVKMITGDSEATAVAVGKTLGLLDSLLPEECKQSNSIMSGEQLRQLLKSDSIDELTKSQEISSKSIFYRVDPLQKADIVARLQQLDKIVAMTGDGVNDVVSMKRANLSIAMGTGADVCKELADVIVVDNDLSVLTAAVIEGKGIHLKIQSFMSYQISLSLSLLILVAISFIMKTHSPFSVIQLLFINLLADGPPAQSLGMEKVQLDDIGRRPRNVHDPLLNCRLFCTLISLTSSLVAVNGVLYYNLIEDGQLDGRDRSLLFTCFVFCTIFSVITLRSKVGLKSSLSFSKIQVL